MRIAHYVSSTHWDREWYEPFQGYRMRLVNMFDEVLGHLGKDAGAHFTMDAQVVAILDYLEIRPENRERVRELMREGRLHVGPWYDLPDEWLVSGESLVRNLQMGVQVATELGGESKLVSRAGAAVDLFGHTAQMPQIFAQMGCPGALIWRGTHEKEHHGVCRWVAPDGTALPTFRFGQEGYVTFWKDVRKPAMLGGGFDMAVAVEKLVEYTLYEAKRTQAGDVLLYDGPDHIEIELHISAMIAQANERLAAHGIRIVQSSLDAYLNELAKQAGELPEKLQGELREPGRDPATEDAQWLIPGVLSSRIHLKQRNAACEDELTLWAEPFSTFAGALGLAYPTGYLRVAWKHLLENHPHDSICGCSIDQVHQDMIYRFDQSYGIASRLTTAALRKIATAAAPKDLPETTLVVTVFNPTSTAIEEPVDLEIRLPEDWAKSWGEFFYFEKKYAFKIKTVDGREVPYQLVGQEDVDGYRIRRAHFPQGDKRHVVSVTAPVSVPAFGYTTLLVEPAEPPTRYLGMMASGHRAIENEALRVEANRNGTIRLTDKRTGRVFDELLTFEQRADIGDGWYHGVAVHDEIFTSTASHAEVALVADGPYKATLRIELTMQVPAEFDFRLMRRSRERGALRIVSDVTLRKGGEAVEVATTVENNVRDHRLRVLLPTHINANEYMADAAFAVVTRKIALVPDSATRRELDVETRPQQTWTALTDGTAGLAVVTRGLPESAVCDTAERPIALTLQRAFRKAVHQGLDRNPGGQVQGSHVFRYMLAPFAGAAPVMRLCQMGQRVLHATRQVDLTGWDRGIAQPVGKLPATHGFLHVTGPVVVTSVQQVGEAMLVRMFNPTPAVAAVSVELPYSLRGAQAITLGGVVDTLTTVSLGRQAVQARISPHRITTLRITYDGQ